MNRRAFLTSLAAAAAPLWAKRPIRVMVWSERTEPVEIYPQGINGALVEMLRHSYAARLLRAGGAATHFAQCARVAGVVPLARLEARQSLPELPALAQLIEEDCGHPA